MNQGWVGMIQVWSEEVRISRWTSRLASSRTTVIREYFRESKVFRWPWEFCISQELSRVKLKFTFPSLLLKTGWGVWVVPNKIGPKYFRL